MTWTRALSPGPLSRRDTGLVAVATIVQVLGVRTGPPAPSPEPLLGLAALLLALAQGLSLLWRRAHAAAVLVASTLGFVAYALRPSPLVGGALMAAYAGGLSAVASLALAARDQV